MGLLILCFGRVCHEISGYGAVQQTQQNYKLLAAGALILFVGVAPGGSLAAAPIAQSAAPDPLLSDGQPGPCNPGLDRPDYVGGVDVAGNSVVPADLPAAKNPVPGEILVPLAKRSHHRADGPVVALDGATLDPLLNPAPSCLAKPR